MKQIKNRRNCLYELTAHKNDGSYIERLFFVNLNSIKRFEGLLRKNKNFTGLSYFPTSTTTPILNTYSINF